jgi:hypothetical protein
MPPFLSRIGRIPTPRSAQTPDPRSLTSLCFGTFCCFWALAAVLRAFLCLFVANPTRPKNRFPVSFGITWYHLAAFRVSGPLVFVSFCVSWRPFPSPDAPRNRKSAGFVRICTRSPRPPAAPPPPGRGGKPNLGSFFRFLAPLGCLTDLPGKPRIQGARDGLVKIANRNSKIQNPKTGARFGTKLCP